MKVREFKQQPYSEKYLNDHEYKEIDEYENIYFVQQNIKKIQPTKLERLVNNGFDDDEGYYRIQKDD